MRRLDRIFAVTATIAAASIFFAPAALARNAEQVMPLDHGVSLVVTAPDVPLEAIMQPVSMPNPAALIQQAEQNMEAILASMMQAAMPQERLMTAAMLSGPQGGADVFVTSFSDGHGTCTQRIIYPANGGSPQIHVSARGDACEMIEAKPVAATKVVSPLPPASTLRAPVQRPQLILADVAG